MKSSSINPNVFSAILLFFAVFTVILIASPVSVRIEPNQSAAQSPIEYTLRTIMGQQPPMAFIGVGGSIDGLINPELKAEVGDTVRLTLINGDPVAHDLAVPDFGVKTPQLLKVDETATLEFVVDRPGSFTYLCDIPGHKEVGMIGQLTITGEATGAPQVAMQPMAQMIPTAAPVDPAAVSIVHSPSDVPAPVGDRAPTLVRVDLVAQEVSGLLADGTSYTYFTFNGTVPGPMIRVRVGDTVELHMKNDIGSGFVHSIDLHAVTGPGGGAVFTQTKPGEETAFTFEALNPGLYVYHCATPSVAHHITSGMYGLILVEPVGGLPPVDREFYVMQGEMYTVQPFGTAGHLDFSHEKMLDEQAEYFTFNGAAGALTADAYALRANVGETVRIFFGVGGPNATSSFHVIGEIFDRVYEQASLTSDPLTNVQTTTVPPGGATMVEFRLEVPGRYILVDHALSRLERGLAGYLYVEGEPNITVFDGEMTAGSGH